MENWTLEEEIAKEKKPMKEHNNRRHLCNRWLNIMGEYDLCHRPMKIIIITSMFENRKNGTFQFYRLFRSTLISGVHTLTPTPTLLHLQAPGVFVIAYIHTRRTYPNLGFFLKKVFSNREMYSTAKQRFRSQV